MFKRIFVLLLLSFISVGSFAQKQWTLEECIDYAMQHNLSIKQVQYNLENSQQNHFQSRGSQLPTLNGTSAYNVNSGRTIDPFTNTYTNKTINSSSLSLSGSWVLFNGLQTRYSISQYSMETRAYEYDLQKIKNDITLQVTSGYLQILLYSEALTNARNQLMVTNIQVDRTKKLVDAGAQTEGTYLDILAQQASEESTLVDAENNFQLAHLSLALLLQIDEVETFRIADPVGLVVPDSTGITAVKDIFDKALSVQPNIMAAQTRNESSQYALSSARGRYMPRLALNYSLSSLYSSSNNNILGYQTTGVKVIGITSLGDSVYTPVIKTLTEKKPVSNQFHDNFNKFIGMTLTIPIVNGFQSRTAVQKAIIVTRQAQTNYEMEKNNLRNSVYTAYANALGALKKYKASLKSSNAQAMAFRSAEKRFEVGVITSLEYNQAKANLSLANSNLLQAKYDYLFKTKILDFYSGNPITL